ncbi:MAG: hypothetical protein ACYC23_22610 [Limisphaerales bacterium]
MSPPPGVIGHPIPATNAWDMPRISTTSGEVGDRIEVDLEPLDRARDFRLRRAD